MQVRLANLDGARAITTEATIWDGQTFILAGRPVEKPDVTRVIFITGTLIDPTGKKEDDQK